MPSIRYDSSTLTTEEVGVHTSPVFKITGQLISIFSLSMLPPMVVALIYGDGGLYAFGLTFLIASTTGLSIVFFFRHENRDFKNKDGYLIVGLFWLVLSLLSAFPYLMTIKNISFINALFESVSGLTTTGINVINNIDTLPHAIQYFRQQTQLLGGLGIIVLAVAILPMLGIGAINLCRAETASPNKNMKLKPRIAESAKALWYIYASLTLACAFSYWLAGMPVFDAIGDSFSTISTGGFSVHSNSFSHYNNHTIEMISCFFMIISATNFQLHYYCIQQKNLKAYFNDIEFYSFIRLIVIASIIVFCSLCYFYGKQLSLSNLFFDAVFTTTSMITTTGLTSSVFGHWPGFLPFLIILFPIIGGCSASTAGGLKIIRIKILRLQVSHEIKQLIHPNAVLSSKLGTQQLSSKMIQSVCAFFIIFITIFILILLSLLITGMDLTSAFGASISTFTNAGASIGLQSIDFHHNTTIQKLIFIVSMICGRLEIFTLLILFTPSYWKSH